MADQQVFTAQQGDSLAKKLLDFYEGLPDDEKVAMAALLAKASPEESVQGYVTPLFASAVQSPQRATTIGGGSALIAPRLSLANIRFAVPISW
jgi:hypothetical protein